jgi:chemotaxis family two-component system sensor kinase Cph1
VDIVTEAIEDALALCAAEPIHVPGSIQPHGVLLAAHGESLTIAEVSVNCASLLGRQPAELLGLPLHTVLPLPDRTELSGDLYDVNPWAAVVAAGPVDVVFHRVGDLLVAELEPAADGGAPWHLTVRAAVQRLQDATCAEALMSVLVAEIARVTGLDRVMAYRFDGEWNGEVLAEQRRPDLEPFLGLRYPASDIPPQARALYVRNWLRLIPDVGYTPVPLLRAESGAPEPPLDLSLSVLRSVSPVHLEYLANMGVAASMSVSLVVEGSLWGLVACHHYAGPYRPSLRERAATEFLARTASVLLSTVISRQFYDAALRSADIARDLSRSLAKPGRSVAEALILDETTVLDLVPAGGAAIRIGTGIRLIGDTPSAAEVATALDTIWPGEERATVATEALSRQHPSLSDRCDVASGLLAVAVPGVTMGAIAWFRPEVLREVTWGGDPTTTKIEHVREGARLTPRQSFAAWSETVRETSSPWQRHDVAAAEHLARLIADTLLARREQDDRIANALQRALLGEGLPELPGAETAVRYLPSAHDIVGADWYDLILLPNGHLAAVVGDVAGHGIGMSAVTAQLRHALRAYLLRELDPALALDRLNELASWLLPEELASIVVIDLDPASQRACIASAGHLPPLLITPDGASLLDVASGPALGLTSSARHSSTVIDIGPHDVLVLFTDGLVERRHLDLDRQLATLAEIGGSLHGTLDDTVEALVEQMGARDGDDDVTVFAVRRRP